ncbi:cytochrome c oxidase subunit 3 [Andreprevotia lacus DSM 23236]|jgi:cytochrome c oxidase subunit 3|uniref:Probable cytochrome c oxidase subunit 3 n=1 Tax=Andreprevotia lacus DSM 23236 TaxID=1121001 RepID=A0A1W1XZ53_9NEIS|nr:cytochrome c oxidase subunit 3 [Andreprevotia lacus]SMC29172.1 cytochrome c oxidase subunit 3 [Andreprevotia lacus DSM 23236]
MNVENGIHDPHYFVPAPSRWPIVGSIALFCMGMGAAFWMNDVGAGKYVLLTGFAILIWMIFGWFGDVIREAQAGQYGTQVDHSLRWGMSWFIFSEVMFFAAFFGALFYARVISVPELGFFSHTHDLLWHNFNAVWPTSTGPKVDPYQPMEAFGLPAINTAILLTSGATLTWAHWGLVEGKRDHLKIGLAITVLLGLSFLTLQAIEYHHAWTEMSLHLASGAYGATFYMLTGFHGMHVLVGTIMLITMLGRALRGHFTPKHHFGFEAAAWYWHFVDVVWLILFVFVYWL